MHVCLHLFISTIPLGYATSFRPLLHSDVFSFKTGKTGKLHSSPNGTIRHHN